MPSQALEAARYAVAGLFCAVLIFAAISDIRTRRIPNWTVLGILVLFAGWAVVGPAISLVSALEAGGIALLVTTILYAFKLIGAGDSKLFTVVALFVGMGYLPQFAFATSMAGGVLAVAALAARPTHTLVVYQMRGKGNLGGGVPYGVAIALAGIAIVAGALSGLLHPMELFPAHG